MNHLYFCSIQVSKLGFSERMLDMITYASDLFNLAAKKCKNLKLQPEKKEKIYLVKPIMDNSWHKDIVRGN